MPRKRHSPEQILGKLREVEVALAKGQTVAIAVSQIAVTELEPRIVAVPGQRLQHRVCVAREAKAAIFVRQPRQVVEHRVDVWRHVQAEELRIVANVGDDRHLRRTVHVKKALQKTCGPNATGDNCDHRPRLQVLGVRCQRPAS